MSKIRITSDIEIDIEKYGKVFSVTIARPLNTIFNDKYSVILWTDRIIYSHDHDCNIIGSHYHYEEIKDEYSATE